MRSQIGSSDVLTELFEKYKRFERVFFRVDKNGEKANYLTLKYQFRMMLTFSVLMGLVSLIILVQEGKIFPLPYPMIASLLIGFRYKMYNMPRFVILIILVVIPVRHMFTGDMIFAASTTIVFTNVMVLVLTQSQTYAFMHLSILTLTMRFFGIEYITHKVQDITVEEVAKITKTAINLVLMFSWINLVGMSRFYAHVNNLLRKIGDLRDNLTKANDQLNDQNHKLQNNLEMKDVFIYTFSHELKNALNGLLGNLYLAYDMTKDSQLIQLLSSAKVCGEVLKNFVHNILDSGKLENGNLEVAPERTDVMNFLENVWTICGRIIENKRLQGWLEISNHVPRYLKLDEQRMIQIILNLVSNACKFTEKGQVRVYVSWEPFSTSAAQQQQHNLQEIPAGQNINDNQALLDPIIEREPDADADGDIEEYLYASESCSFNKQRLHLITEHPKKFIADSQFYQLSLSKWHWNCEEVLSSSKLEGEPEGIFRVQVFRRAISTLSKVLSNE